jgi:hypothetical protein
MDIVGPNILADEKEETILQELYKTVHGFWDPEINEKVPGIIDEQQEQGRQIRKLSTGQKWIMGGVAATFLAVVGSGHVNGTLLIEAIKLLTKAFNG